ncbi:ATP-dependent DNA helicase PIF1-like [Physella acuta]|uniref:ATP-dependent DNA helicase PIF1-like n=1 Tax=Physella acuta TaxID=109671 RepID=UPI0027DB8E22|nr:ATP-dependent DNA helicase PIF1-like [Physella acuta]XP_059151762.1 ATP-dependent DNA helicase PIF1-like [Physella acuta]
MANASLTCSVCIEELSATGNVIKKSQYQNLNICLGRDEFREILIKVIFPKKESKYSVKELLIHKKFVKDGKATIKLPEHKIQLLLSNCPPDQLVMFLHTLQAKLDVLKQKGFLTQRQKLFSGKHHEFEEISPLTVKDLQVSHGARGQSSSQPSSLTTHGITSSHITKKRSLPSSAQENSPTSLENEAKRQKLMAAKTAFLKLTKINGISPSKVLAKPIQLTPEQNRVLEAVLKGRNIFFTGSAGTGKSFLLKRIVGALPPNHTFATASTGVAACHIGGTTLHAFAGIGSGKAPLSQCVELASRQKVAQQWRACRHLIIDEISMVDGDFFNKLETVARVVRKSDQPFGGIQLILCGDFLQLPPVTGPGEDRKFCFQSEAWQKSIDVTMHLTDVKRQSDKKFIDLLQQIRKGLCPPTVARTLQETGDKRIEKDGVVATKLCTHKVDVEQINISKLKELAGESYMFTASDVDEAYTQQLNTLCPVPAFLELKVGAQVMLCKNLDIQRGLVNGARGVVLRIEAGNPVIKFVCGVTETIKAIRWVFKIGGGNTIVRKQIPLKLAWAISIHKSQGMTLDCVEISLAKVFETGQAYVALSRAKSLEGLRVVDFNMNCVRADPKVLNFYTRLELKHKMMHNGVEDENEIFRPNPSVFNKR